MCDKNLLSETENNWSLSLLVALITSENSLEPDQDRRKGPDVVPNRLTLFVLKNKRTKR